MQARQDLAETWLSRLTATSSTLRSTFLQSLFTVVTEFVEELITSEKFCSAVKWLALVDQFFDRLSGRGFSREQILDLRLAVSHMLLRIPREALEQDDMDRILASARDAESLDNGSLPRSLAILDLFGPTHEGAGEHPLNGLARIMCRARLTQPLFDMIVHYVYVLRIPHPGPTHDLLRTFLSERLGDFECQGWIERLVVLLVWSQTSAEWQSLQCVMDTSTMLNRITKQTGRGVSFAASKVCQMVRNHRAYFHMMLALMKF